MARGSVARRELPGGVTPAEILALEDLGRRRRGVVYLGGSLVEGRGNPWSDVDVFVVGNLRPVGPDVKPGDVNTVSVHFYKGVRFDFEYWTPEHVRDLARRLRSIRLGITRSLTRTTFSYIEECFLHRLRTGRPLRDARGFRKWQSRFNFPKFALYQAQETVRHVDAMLGYVRISVSGGVVTTRRPFCCSTTNGTRLTSSPTRCGKPARRASRWARWYRAWPPATGFRRRKWLRRSRTHWAISSSWDSWSSSSATVRLPDCRRGN